MTMLYCKELYSLYSLNLLTLLYLLIFPSFQATSYALRVTRYALLIVEITSKKVVEGACAVALAPSTELLDAG